MNFCTIDGEWEKETAKQFCWSYWKDNSGEIFDTAALLLQYIFSQATGKENLIIYAHYGGGSDFLFLLREIIGRKDCYLNEKEFYQASSRIISFTVYHGKRKFQFRDSYAILPASLDNLGRNFIGETKIFDSRNLENLPIEEIQKHCLNDARILFRSIESFMNILHLEKLELTAASQALLDMRQLCDFDKLKPQSKQEYENFLPWFAGGHVDVYRRFAAPCYQYDIKSCYPTSQCYYGCPFGDFKQGKTVHSDSAGLYQIKCKTSFYNPFFFHKTNQKTYWVNSENIILCTDIELRKLDELKIPFKILQAYEWKCDWDFFKPFVRKWFEFRKKGQAQKEIGKIYLNAGGFGKFAIRRDRESIVFGDGADYYLSPDYEIGIKRIWKDFDYSQIHIASRITAGARLLLYDAQTKIGVENICYSDTDSIFSSIPYNKEIYKGELGQLELAETYQRTYFLGNKFYGGVKLDNSFKAVLKGFPERFSEQNYHDALFNNNINFKYSSQGLLKFRSAIRRNSDFVAIKELKREIDHIEIKRKLLSNGIDTKPYKLRGDILS